jgi:hypothetical protein
MGWAHITDIRLVTAHGVRAGARAADEDLVFEIDLASRPEERARLRGLVVEMVFSSEEGHPLFSVMNVDDGGAELPDTDSCTLQLRIAAPTFVPGRYRVRAFLGVPHAQHVDEIDDAFEFEVTAPVHPWRPYELSPLRGRMCRRGQWAAFALRASACQAADVTAAGNERMGSM